MTVTLDWFRDRTFDVPTLNIDEIAQSDLDLYVRDTITGNIISESISSVNDVEHLYFTLPRTSLYQLEVNFFGTIFDFSGTHNSEQYGLGVVHCPGGGSGTNELRADRDWAVRICPGSAAVRFSR